MSIHALPDIPGVDVAELIAREMAGEDSIETQDDPDGIDRQERRRADAIYFSTIRREGLRSKRRELHDVSPYGD